MIMMSEEFFVFRCKECGKIKTSLGSLHGHAERHTGFFSVANVDKLMSLTEILRVKEVEEVSLEEFEKWRDENDE